MIEQAQITKGDYFLEPVPLRWTDIVIIVFIYLSIFINSFVFFKEPFEFQFGYLIYILLLPVLLNRYGVPSGLLMIFSLFFFTGMVNIVLGNNTFALFFKVFTGLTLSYFFYYLIIVQFEFDIEKLFKWYLMGAYISVLIAIFQFVSFQVGFEPGYNYRWVFNKWGFATGGLFGIRINSVFAEPTHLATTLSAAFFISAYNLFRKETIYISRTKSILIVIVYLLSFSGVGQLGIFLTIILIVLNYGLVRYIFLLIPLMVILFNVIYNNVVDFRDRFDGLVSLYEGTEFKVGKIHGSSFVLYNNFRVTVENFKTNFIFGSGIGSHPVAFEKYSLAKNIKVYGFNLNGADANSMLLRMFSETGLFGVSLFLYIVFKCFVRRNPEYETYHWLVSNAILVMILLNLFRQGHYFLNGFPFFVLLYYFNYLSYKKTLDASSQ